MSPRSALKGRLEMAYDTTRSRLFLLLSGGAAVQSYVFALLLVLAGTLFDYATTVTGLSLGLSESNPQYSPIWAFLFFAWAIALLFVALPRKIRKLGAIGLALSPYLAAANNVLVILGFIV